MLFIGKFANNQRFNAEFNRCKYEFGKTTAVWLTLFAIAVLLVLNLAVGYAVVFSVNTIFGNVIPLNIWTSLSTVILLGLIKALFNTSTHPVN